MLYFRYFKMGESRAASGLRLNEGLRYRSRNFRKAFYAIRTKRNSSNHDGGTEEDNDGMACAVKTEDKNNDRILLVTCSDICNGIQNSKNIFRFSRRHFGTYRLRPAPVRQYEQFSCIWGDIVGHERWVKRFLKPKYLNKEEQKNDFLVYTIDDESCKVLKLKLKYNKGTKRHDLKDSRQSYKLGGSPIISRHKRKLVGVLNSDGEACFLCERVFGE